MLRHSILLLTCAGLAAVQALAAEPPAQGNRQAVALLKFESEGASEFEISDATERLLEELLATGRYGIVDRAQFATELKEQALQPSGCEGTECAVKAAKRLGARKLVAGKVTRLRGETQWLVSASLVDVESGKTERAASIEYEGPYPDLLRSGMPILAAKLAGTEPPEMPGFAAKVEDIVTSPIRSQDKTPEATPRPNMPLPMRGFAAYFGRATIAGKVQLKGGQSLGYSIDSYILGLDYQWLLAEFFTIAAFLEFGGGNPQGQMARFYSDSAPGGFGAEVRYWRSPWYGFGSLGSYYTTLLSQDPAKQEKQQLQLSGTSLGFGIGYEWERWYATGAWDHIDMSATPPADPTFPQGKSATENRIRLKIGYRWKKP